MSKKKRYDPYYPCLSCSRPVTRRNSRCMKCYGLIRHRGTPQTSLLEKIVKDDKSRCWNFAGQINEYGYGVIGSIRGPVRRRYYAHRVSYEMHKGPIPDGLTIDHLCRNTHCVNPDHLEAVTNSENVRRSNLVLGTPRQRQKKRRLASDAGENDDIAAARKSTATSSDMEADRKDK